MTGRRDELTVRRAFLYAFAIFFGARLGWEAAAWLAQRYLS